MFNNCKKRYAEVIPFISNHNPIYIDKMQMLITSFIALDLLLNFRHAVS